MTRPASWRHAVLQSGLPPTTRYVLLVWSFHMTDAGETCVPTLDTLVAETGLDNNTVAHQLRIAKKASWLTEDGRAAFPGL